MYAHNMREHLDAIGNVFISLQDLDNLPSGGVIDEDTAIITAGRHQVIILAHEDGFLDIRLHICMTCTHACSIVHQGFVIIDPGLHVSKTLRDVLLWQTVHNTLSSQNSIQGKCKSQQSTTPIMQPRANNIKLVRIDCCNVSPCCIKPELGAGIKNKLDAKCYQV